MFDVELWLCGHGETKDQTVACMIEAIQHLPMYKIHVEYFSGDALIGRSRSIAATKFLEGNHSQYMIFLDTDILFKPSELEDLIKALEAGYDVVGGAYGVANGDHYAIRAYNQTMTLDGSIRPIEYISTGFMGISRKALETIKTKLELPILHEKDWCRCYPFFESGRYMEEKLYISEDWDFCNKARQAGFTVYFHTGCLVDHMKTNIIIAEDIAHKHEVKKEAKEGDGKGSSSSNAGQDDKNPAQKSSDTGA